MLPDRSKYLHRVFRFYFDGLVCMFELPGATSVRVREVPDFYVGGNKFLIVQMMDFDNSREKIEMVMHSVDSFRAC
ncbi:hypothetical protein GVI59_18305 [Acetobacter sicerae]|nr:hypothetical protein [Acetobacter sicerae]